MDYKTFFTHSLGCKVNAYETEALATLLKEQGYARVDDPRSAKVIILNTCAVTQTASKKSRQHISSYREVNKEAILVAMGCYSQIDAEKCLERGADIVLGTGKRKEAVGLIEEFAKTGKKVVSVAKEVRKQGYEEFGTAVLEEKQRAYLKVQDGCDSFCSYCYIPRLRGNSRSRDPREAVAEATRLCELGYKEIVITGVHIGYYGRDLGDGSFGIADLLEAILRKNPSLPRLRISSIEQGELDTRFLNLLSAYPQIVSHFHVPLQSGSDATLKRMGRRYDSATYLQTIEKIREIRPEAAITTDLIAGFPGESEAEWEETLATCEKARFAEVHVFPFSARPGTPAAAMPNQVDSATKSKRVHAMLSLSKAMRTEYEKAFYGRKLPVLIEEKEGGYCLGHSENYLLCRFPCEASVGEITEVVFGPDVAAD